MRLHIILLLSLGLLLSQAVLKAQSQLTVTVYQDENYRGNSRQVNVSRCENILDFNDRGSSIRTPGCVILYEDACCQAASLQVTGDTESFPRSFKNKLTSLSPCGSYRAPLPATINETWLGHSQTMRKMVEDGDIAVYYNDAVSGRALENHREYLKKLWAYVKATYGDFGPEGGRVIAYMHANATRPTYGFNSLQNYFDIPSSCRNLVDLVGGSQNAWSNNLTGFELDVLTHEISHIVERASYRVHGSPSFRVWGDSKWAEIFIYDVYDALRMTKERDRAYREFYDQSDNFPRRNTRWFKDWFYPVYSQNGKAAMLNRYFKSLSQYYPRQREGWQYIRRSLNLGEFVHFFSGAAGKDLKSQATTAFGWSDETERDFQQAKVDYPDVRY